jgi:3-oxoacyl-[acyl-carrier-protein] synthase III
MLDGTIQPGDRLVFCISGSGMTLGTALYTFDDLPDRVRAAVRRDGRRSSVNVAGGASPAAVQLMPQPRVRIRAVGTANSDAGQTDTQDLARRAGESCLAASSYDRRKIDVLMGVGLYRSEFIAEPAAATLVANDLRMNEESDPLDENKTFAFDLLNGPAGFLDACYVAAGLIRANSFDSVMIVASEEENNIRAGAAGRRGLANVGSAVILDRSEDGRTGFSSFLFKDHTQHLSAFRAFGSLENGRTRLAFERTPGLEGLYVECIADSVDVLLRSQRLELAQFKTVLPPQISSEFISRLAHRLGADSHRFVDLASDDLDLFTSSLPAAFEHVRRQQLAANGDLGLLISVGAGITVGCAIYQF